MTNPLFGLLGRLWNHLSGNTLWDVEGHIPQHGHGKKKHPDEADIIFWKSGKKTNIHSASIMWQVHNTPTLWSHSNPMSRHYGVSFTYKENGTYSKKELATYFTAVEWLILDLNQPICLFPRLLLFNLMLTPVVRYLPAPPAPPPPRWGPGRTVKLERLVS